MATDEEILEEVSQLAQSEIASEETVSSRVWRPGDDINAKTSKGKLPTWTTIRASFWKNEAADPQMGPWSSENLARMQRGSAPQRFNPDKGGMESMELSHEPIPQRDGGTEFTPRWPQDHAGVDPFRRPGY